MARAKLGVIDPATTSGTALAAMLSDRDAAENSGHIAATGRPDYATDGMLYSIGDGVIQPRLWLAVGPAGPDIDLSTLFNPRPGTIRHTAEVVLPDGWLWCDGSTVARAGAGSFPALFDAICPPFTGTANTGSNVISGITITGWPGKNFNASGLIGAVVEGPAGLNGAIVTAVSTTSITVSLNANATLLGSFRVFPHGNGNGGTTFTLPNAKGRTIIGRTDMNGNENGFITVAGSGVDGTKLGAGGGAQNVTLGIANVPAHAHTGGVSLNQASIGYEGAHTHTFSDTTSTTSGASPATHVHGALAPGTSFMQDVADGTGNITIGSGNRVKFIGSTGAGGAHTHTVAVSGTTAAGTSHTHTFSGTFILTMNSGPPEAISTPINKLPPCIVENVVIKT
jgi:microcystin-dependent protein